MLCCSVLLLPRLCCAGPELPRLLLGVAVGRVARDADVLLLWPGHVVRLQEIELIIEMHINISAATLALTIYTAGCFFSLATLYTPPILGHQGRAILQSKIGTQFCFAVKN